MSTEIIGETLKLCSYSNMNGTLQCPQLLLDIFGKVYFVLSSHKASHLQCMLQKPEYLWNMVRY